MSDPNATPPAPNVGAVQEGPLSPAGVKALKFAVIAMGVLIIIGMVVVIGRVIYLASTPKSARTAKPPAAAVEMVANAKVLLPQGTTAKQTTLDANRLSILYEGAGRSGVMIVDLATGSVVSHITLSAPAQQ